MDPRELIDSWLRRGAQKLSQPLRQLQFMGVERDLRMRRHDVIVVGRKRWDEQLRCSKEIVYHFYIESNELLENQGTERAVARVLNQLTELDAKLTKELPDVPAPTVPNAEREAAPSKPNRFTMIK